MGEQVNEPAFDANAVIQPQPIPTAFAVGHGEDGKFVLLAMKNPVGEFNFFLPITQVQQFVNAVVSNARAAQGKLNGGLIIPNVINEEAMRALTELKDKGDS